MPSERPFRLGSITATLLTTFVAPLAVSLVSSAIKAETTIHIRAGRGAADDQAGRPAEPREPAVILLPPSPASCASLSAPRPWTAKPAGTP